MIDHTGLEVRSFTQSREFYEKALGAIGYKPLMEFPMKGSGPNNIAGFGVPPKPDFWISEGTPNQPPIHVAFRVESRDLVDAFYKAAITAGGRDNGPPGLRPQYHQHYYGAFVLDPDGHNIEAVCHLPV